MMKIVILALALAAKVAADDCVNDAWAQCGGDGFTGDACCPAAYECKYENDYYSGCSLKDLCLVVQFGQCDGVDADGAPWPEDQKCCPDSFECTYQSAYYSQCSPTDSNTTDCSIAYGQCGGDDTYDGPECCVDGYECTVTNEFYSGCTPIPICTNAFYGQCDGQDADGNDWSKDHDKCCPDGFTCTYQSEYFSQCCPDGGCNAAEARPAFMLRGAAQ